MTAICSNLLPVRAFKKRKYLLPVVVFLAVPLIYIQLTFPVRYMFKNSNIREACIIPKLNPFDPSILQFVWKVKPLICDTSPAVVFLDEDGQMQYNKTAVRLLKLKESNIKCQYKTLHRDADDKHVTFSAAVLLSPPHRVEADFFHVICKDENEHLLLDELFASVKRKEKSHSGYFKEESKEQLNVLMFAIDSVSRSAAIRKLPKTVKFLKEELKSYDFEGYMKVGENTLPNVTPLLTGRRVWTSEMPISDYSTQPFNAFPFLWKNFSRHGYATMYAEDMPHLGTFSYLTRGFKEQPTDHYMTPFWLGVNELNVVKSSLNPVFQYLEDKNLNPQGTSTLCYGHKAKHMIQIDYLKQFYSSYHGKRKFSIVFINEICHDYPNFLEYADEDLVDFLQWLRLKGYLENTVVVIFSDHGSRIDKIRNTYVGRIEDRMPMVHLVIPEHIKASYPELDENIKINTKRLATPFDLHRTLIDVLEQNFKSPTQYYIDGSLRGISLFRPLPPDRSCVDAWIPENYCACYTSSPVNVTIDRFVRSAADSVVHWLNNQLTVVPACSPLQLFKVQAAQLISQGLKHSGTENTGISLFQFFRPESQKALRYLVVIETVPGHGVFEGTVDVNTNSGSNKIIGEVIRVNRYGNQSHCIMDKLLRPLCFCKKQLDA